jgi:hypothetical protein
MCLPGVHHLITQLPSSVRSLHDALVTAGFYASSAGRVLPRGGISPRTRLGRGEERLVFVVGCPRSGTSFLAGAIGSLPGFVDLGEVTPLKAVLPTLASLPPEKAAGDLRRQLEALRRLGLVRGLRGVEQTPELAFMLPAVLVAYQEARVVHIVRDGRDVAASLLERGWLSASREGRDDAHLPYGAYSRFWVEPELAEEFPLVSDARRAAWAWRRYVTAARHESQRVLEIRYEDLALDPTSVAARIAEHLDAPLEPVERSLARAHAESLGRFRDDLTPEQLEDVELEAGPLLRSLGYAVFEPSAEPVRPKRVKTKEPRPRPDVVDLLLDGESGQPPF